MLIFVKYKEKEISITIEPEDLILAIKVAILEKEGIPTDQQNLFLGGKRLENDSHVKDYGINFGANIKLLLNGEVEEIVTQNDEHAPVETYHSVPPQDYNQTQNYNPPQQDYGLQQPPMQQGFDPNAQPPYNPQFNPQVQQPPMQQPYIEQNYNPPQQGYGLQQQPPQGYGLQQPPMQQGYDPNAQPPYNPQFIPQMPPPVQEPFVEPTPSYPTQVDKGTLTIHCNRAYDLVAADMNGFSDPYLVFTIGDQTVKTKVIYKNLNPVWDQNLTLNLTNITQNSVLHMACFDKDKIGKDDFLGEASIYLAGLVSGVQRKETYKLEDTEKGSVELGITADFSLQGFPPLTTIPSGNITVKIVQARNLIAADLNGKSDPFALVVHGQCTNKTKVIDKTLDPVWNESFYINMTNFNQKTVLPIMVFDHDTVGSDEFIGIAFVPLAGLFKGDTSKKWYKLHGVKKGEIEIEMSVDFDLPNIAPILYEEIIRKAAKRVKASIKALVKMQKKQKGIEKKSKSSSTKTKKFKKPKLSKGSSARNFKRGLSKGIGKMGSGLLWFGLLVVDILVHVL